MHRMHSKGNSRSQWFSRDQGALRIFQTCLGLRRRQIIVTVIIQSLRQKEHS